MNYEIIEAYRTYGEECYGHSNKPNKNMTLTSLIAFFKLLEADNSEDFCANYILAFHDNNGASIWNLIVNTEKYDEVRKQRMKAKYKSIRDAENYIFVDGKKIRNDRAGKRHWYNNGTENKLFYSDDVPEGWKIGWIGNWANQFGRGTK